MDESGQTALHTACFLGTTRRDIVELLLEAGAVECAPWSAATEH